MLGRYDDAQKSFEKAAEMSPQNIDPLLRLGFLFMDENKLDKARNAFQAAAAIDGKNAALHLILADIALGMKDYANASSEISYSLNFSRSPQVTSYAEKMKLIISKKQ